MKPLLLAIMMLIFSCTKETADKQTVQEQQASSNISIPSVKQITIKIKIVNMCFDGSRYLVDYYTLGLSPADKVYGGAISGKDTLSKVLLPTDNNAWYFYADTKDKGCNVTIYVTVIKRFGYRKSATKAGTCASCLITPNKSPNSFNK